LDIYGKGSVMNTRIVRSSTWGRRIDW
jgi:hypothetical protein